MINDKIKIVICGGNVKQREETAIEISKVLTEHKKTSKILPDFQKQFFITDIKQSKIIKTQIKREKTKDEYDVIICSGGLAESLVYMNEDIDCNTYKEVKRNLVSYRNSYNAVFALPPQDEISQKAVYSWVGHEHLRMGNSKEEIIAEILFFMGVFQSLEIERKFLIKMPDIQRLEKMNNCSKSNITQIYLKGDLGRIRKRIFGEQSVYYHTRKKRLSNTTRIEIERKIGVLEYNYFLMYKRDKNRASVIKDRYCLLENGKYFEIDVFPFWKDMAFLEIELKNEDENFTIPEYITTIKEVTQDKNYTNRSLAKRLKDGNI
ncbi:MAG: hypothetical protein IJC89_04140 [Clostridia bacterium]|nr:hypothetical protein [Clostridia bacterium]